MQVAALLLCPLLSLTLPLPLPLRVRGWEIALEEHFMVPGL